MIKLSSPRYQSFQGAWHTAIARTKLWRTAKMRWAYGWIQRRSSAETSPSPRVDDCNTPERGGQNQRMVRTAAARPSHSPCRFTKQIFSIKSRYPFHVFLETPGIPRQIVCQNIDAYCKSPPVAESRIFIGFSFSVFFVNTGYFSVHMGSRQ